MKSQTVLIQKLVKDKNFSFPSYQTDGSAGMDLSAFIKEDILIKPNERKIISTGIAISLPQNLEAQVRPRSGLAIKHGITVLNSPGTIDSDYRGEIKVILINLGREIFRVEKGHRIAQMVVCPIIQAEFKEVDDLTKTVRGEGGFGSTGNK